MNTGTMIIIAVVIGIVVLGIISSRKHFGGEGGCCGGGGDVKEPEKKLDGKVIEKKIVEIEGMHCEHCRNSVERFINKLDGASAKANYKKGMAYVSCDRTIKDEDIVRAVETAGFNVKGIKSEKM